MTNLESLKDLGEARENTDAYLKLVFRQDHELKEGVKNGNSKCSNQLSREKIITFFFKNNSLTF